MRTAWKKIRYRMEWLALKFATKFVPILSRKACYRLALLLGSLGAMLDRRGRLRSEQRREITRGTVGALRVAIFSLVRNHETSRAVIHFPNM
jgi:hypothetical protein